jgi:transposase
MKQKTDREDARLMQKLLLENRFPRIWVPDPENRDLRQLLWHRHRLVQMRTRIMNQLQALAMNEGYRWPFVIFHSFRIQRLRAINSSLLGPGIGIYSGENFRANLGFYCRLLKRFFLLSAHRFFISSDNRFLPAGVR